MNIHSDMAARVPDTHKEDAILAAALELFVERGFHGTNVPSVAERAGVAPGTIYHYFASKEELVNILYRRWKSAIGQTVVVGFPIDRPAREQFRTVWERMADFAIAHPRELEFLELHHHRAYLDEQSRATESQVFDFGVAMVKKAQVEQVLRPLDPVLLMAFGNGAFLGVFRQIIAKRLPLTKASFMDAEQCCWEAIRA